MAALRARGLAVSAHKVGPDYIDPELPRGRDRPPGRNLDPWLTGEELIAPLFLHGAAGADVAVIEGVMGLFDGAAGPRATSPAPRTSPGCSAPPSSWSWARAGAGRSIAATVHGFASYDPRVRVAGVVLNQVSSARGTSRSCARRSTDPASR